MLEVSPSRFGQIVMRCALQGKRALFGHGQPGIGKSEVVMRQAMAYAKLLGREFVTWNERQEGNLANIAALLQDPKRYYLFVDMRLSQRDSTDLQGFPDVISAKDHVTMKPYAWALFLSHPDGAGCVFLDEFNQAMSNVQNAAFELVHDRRIAGRPLSPMTSIVAAGNEGAKDGTFIQEMSSALKDRFMELRLKFSLPDLIEYLYGTSVHPIITAFAVFEASRAAGGRGGLATPGDCCFISPVPPPGSDDKMTTPRGIVRAGLILSQIQDALGGSEDSIFSEEASETLSMNVGAKFSGLLQAFAATTRKLNIPELMKDPSALERCGVETRYVFASALADMSINQPDVKTFTPVVACLIKFPKSLHDFGIITLRSLKGALRAKSQEAKWKGLVEKTPRVGELIQIYGKYLLDDQT